MFEKTLEYRKNVLYVKIPENINRQDIEILKKKIKGIQIEYGIRTVIYESSDLSYYFEELKD